MNDRQARIEPQDGVGVSYDELVEMATASYWVVPINTDDTSFARWWYVSDRAESGEVHYSRSQ